MGLHTVYKQQLDATGGMSVSALAFSGMSAINQLTGSVNTLQGGGYAVDNYTPLRTLHNGDNAATVLRVLQTLIGDLMSQR